MGKPPQCSVLHRCRTEIWAGRSTPVLSVICPDCKVDVAETSPSNCRRSNSTAALAAPDSTTSRTQPGSGDGSQPSTPLSFHHRCSKSYRFAGRPTTKLATRKKMKKEMVTSVSLKKGEHSTETLLKTPSKENILSVVLHVSVRAENSSLHLYDTRWTIGHANGAWFDLWLF